MVDASRWPALLYRLALQGIDVPATVLIGLVKSALGLLPPGDLLVRLQYVRGIWTWRPMCPLTNSS